MNKRFLSTLPGVLGGVASKWQPGYSAVTAWSLPWALITQAIRFDLQLCHKVNYMYM